MLLAVEPAIPWLARQGRGHHQLDRGVKGEVGRGKCSTAVSALFPQHLVKHLRGSIEDPGLLVPTGCRGYMALKAKQGAESLPVLAGLAQMRQDVEGRQFRGVTGRFRGLFLTDLAPVAQLAILDGKLARDK